MEQRSQKHNTKKESSVRPTNTNFEACCMKQTIIGFLKRHLLLTPTPEEIHGKVTKPLQPQPGPGPIHPPSRHQPAPQVRMRLVVLHLIMSGPSPGWVFGFKPPPESQAFRSGAEVDTPPTVSGPVHRPQHRPVTPASPRHPRAAPGGGPRRKSEEADTWDTWDRSRTSRDRDKVEKDHTYGIRYSCVYI